jgi:zinc protease
VTRRLLAIILLATACAHHPTSAPQPSSRAPSSLPVQSLPPSPPASFWANRTDLIHAPPPPRPAELQLPPVERWTLKNGLEVIVVPRKDLPVVSFSIAIRAGGYDEQKGRTLGVADFTAAMLRRGTRTRSADDISRAIDFAGGALDAQAADESSTAGCSALSRDTKLCLDLLSDILLHPTFPEDEMAEVRDQMLAALGSRYDDPHELANEHFDNLLFGEEHPAGWVLEPADVHKITRASLVAFWNTFYRPNNAILAVAGNVDAARLRADLERAFGSWRRGPIPARPLFAIPPLASSRILLVDRPDLTQSTIVFGHAGIKHTDPAFYAVTLMNYVLGGSDFSSRLMTEVRAKRGLTYGIGSSFGAPLYQGAFKVLAATRNETAWEALRAAVDELRRMKASGPTVAELDKAKGYYAGSYPFNLQTAAGIASGIVGAELHGLGVDYVRELPVRLAAVGEAAAKQAARDFLFPDTLLIVMVGNGSALERQVASSGIPYQRINFKDPISQAARAAAAAAAGAHAAPAPARQ